MARIGRGFPPQWIEPNLGGPERALGPEPPQPSGPPPVVRTLSINTTRSWNVTRRPARSSLSAPTVVNPLPTLQQQTITTQLEPLKSPQDTGRQRRAPIWKLSPPTVVAVAQAFAGPAVTSVATRTRVDVRRRTPLQGWTEVSVFALGASAVLQAALVQPLVGVKRPLVILPLPDATQTNVKSTYKQAVAQSRRARTTRSNLSEPTFVAAAAAVFAGPATHTVASRRPKTISRVAPPTVTAASQLSAPIVVALTHTRPRATHASLTAISYPATSKIQTSLVRSRPRATVHRLTAVTYSAVSDISVTLVRIRPRATAKVLARPTALATFPSGKPTIVRMRPRRTLVRLSPPATLEPESVQLAERAVKVVATVRNRPRKTVSFLTAVSYPATSEITVATVRTRPRHTVAVLRKPTVLQTFQAASAHETRTRPRHTIAVLSPPATIEPESIALAERTIRVSLARTRPRRTAASLTAVTYPATSDITVTAVRTRPRPTTTFLAPPTVLATFAAPETPLVRTRPRHTVAYLGRPTAVRVPAVEQAEDTIRVETVVTRPRATTATLAPPTVVVVNPPVVTRLNDVSNVARERRAWTRHFPQQGQRQRIVRETGSTVTYQQRDPFVGPRPPQIIGPLPIQRQQTVAVAVVRTRPRHTTVALRRPTVLQTFAGPTVALTRTRPRATVVRRITPVVYKQTSDILVSLVRTRPPATTKTLAPPAVVRAASVEQQLRTIAVTRTRTRPRATTSILGAPIFAVRTFGGAKTSITRTRPAAVRSKLHAPTVVRVPSVEQAEDTVRVSIVRTRPRRTVAAVSPPPSVLAAPVEHTVRVTTVTTRPRATTHRLPAVTYAAPVVTTITVATVTARPPATSTFLTAPAAAVFFRTPVVTQILTWEDAVSRMALLRRRPTHHLGTPTVTVVVRAGVTYGIDTAASGVIADSIDATNTSDDSQEASGNVSQQAAAVESGSDDIAATSAEGEDKEAGT